MKYKADWTVTDRTQPLAYLQPWSAVSHSRTRKRQWKRMYNCIKKGTRKAITAKTCYHNSSALKYPKRGLSITKGTVTVQRVSVWCLMRGKKKVEQRLLAPWYVSQKSHHSTRCTSILAICAAVFARGGLQSIADCEVKALGWQHRESTGRREHAIPCHVHVSLLPLVLY